MNNTIDFFGIFKDLIKYDFILSVCRVENIKNVFKKKIIQQTFEKLHPKLACRTHIFVISHTRGEI